MLFDFVVAALLTLFVVVDPIGLAPTFLAVTEGLPRAARRSVAVRASIIAGAILIGSALIGDWLLDTLKISLAAFRIAGGLLLFSIASEMVLGVRMRREGAAAEQAVEEHVRDIAAFPLDQTTSLVPLLQSAVSVSQFPLPSTGAAGCVPGDHDQAQRDVRGQCERHVRGGQGHQCVVLYEDGEHEAHQSTACGRYAGICTRGEQSGREHGQDDGNAGRPDLRSQPIDAAARSANQNAQQGRESRRRNRVAPLRAHARLRTAGEVRVARK